MPFRYECAPSPPVSLIYRWDGSRATSEPAPEARWICWGPSLRLQWLSPCPWVCSPDTFPGGSLLTGLGNKLSVQGTETTTEAREPPDPFAELLQLFLLYGTSLLTVKPQLLPVKWPIDANPSCFTPQDTNHIRKEPGTGIPQPMRIVSIPKSKHRCPGRVAEN